MKLVHAQKKILIIGVGLVVLMLLVPPWREGHGNSTTPAGYSLIFMPPGHGDYRNVYFNPHIDWSRLLLPILAVVIATAGAFFAVP